MTKPDKGRVSRWIKAYQEGRTSGLTVTMLAEIAMEGALDPSRDDFEEVSARARQGLIFISKHATKEARRQKARETARQLGADARRLRQSKLVSSVVLGGAPGLGRKA